MPAPRVHFDVLDGLRGVCAYFVVLFHFYSSTSTIYHVRFFGNSYLFVDFFFVLSGFVISYNYAGRLRTGRETVIFLILRTCRVYPLHVFMTVVFLFWMVIWGGTPDWFVVLANVLLIHALGVLDTIYLNYPSWSISAEFYTYVIFAFLAWRLASLKALLVASFVIVIASLMVIGLFSPDYMDATSDFGLIRCLAGFFVGVLVQHAYGRVSRVWSPAAAPRASGESPRRRVAWTALEAAAILLTIAFVTAGSRDAAVSLLAPVVFGVVVFVFAFEAGAFSKLLSTRAVQYIGVRSYSIYMVHAFAIVLVEIVSYQLLLATGVNPQHGPELLADGYIVFYCAVVLGLSALTYRWVEQPGRRLGKWLTRPRAPVVPVVAMTVVAPSPPP